MLVATWEIVMLAALALLAVQAASPAAAASPEQADARCVAALAVMNNAVQGDENGKRAAQLGSMFFVGKIIGRNPRADLTRLLGEASPAVAPSVKPELQRCAIEIQRAGEAVVAAGAALQQKLPPAPAKP